MKLLSEKNIKKNPVEQFSLWYKDALGSGFLHPDAMTLATASKKGKPSARIVLLKSFDEGGFVFFTNYGSRKGSEITKNPYGALLFYWDKTDRQVRVEGKIKKISLSESEEYFFSRPRGSRIGALASEQSKVIKSREALLKRFEELNKKYEGKEIPLPDYWGGFRLVPDCFEFWQSRENRLHDRIRFVKTKSGWKIERLAP